MREHLRDVIVIDDGSDEAGRHAVEKLEAEGLAEVIRRKRNGGKGAAVMDGLRHARDRGFTHALQIDADGQHDVHDVPRLLKAAREAPDALVLGSPVFDESAPRGRLLGRRLTVFWARVETGGSIIADPLYGFRVYPVHAALESGVRGRRMEFDPEIAVRMTWKGAPVVNVVTRCRYLPREQGGVSHFRMGRDNVRISIMHSRLVTEKILRALARGRRGGVKR